MTTQAGMPGMLARGMPPTLEALKKQVQSRNQARPAVNASSSATAPQARIPLFEALYSNKTLTVQCRAEPEDPSSAAISMLVLQAKNPQTGMIFCEGSSSVGATSTPPVGTTLETYCSTQLFAPSTDGSSVTIGYFGFITDERGQSFEFEGSKTVDVGAS